MTKLILIFLIYFAVNRPNVVSYEDKQLYNYTFAGDIKHYVLNNHKFKILCLDGKKITYIE